VSAPLFNLAEELYALGWQGLTIPINESPIETLCNLTADNFNNIVEVSASLGFNPYGLVGELAQRGIACYCPARDGFVLADLIAALSDPAVELTPEERAEAIEFMSLAIYSFDAYALGAYCNVCIHNNNGLQADDGSVTEVGMCGMRAMPTTMYRSQDTTQFDGAINPMPLGNITTVFTQQFQSVTEAVDNLEQKIQNVLESRPTWLGAVDYSTLVPPPPLYIYWASIGEAVFLSKYRTKNIVVDENGVLDKKASFTDEFYEKLVVDRSNKAIAEMALIIAARMKEVQARLQPLIPLWAGLSSDAV
jgi:hypothetical protein